MKVLPVPISPSAVVKLADPAPGGCKAFARAIHSSVFRVNWSEPLRSQIVKGN
ncbi:MAG: hypothetical protein QOG53_3048 [Frankiales bacterium]|jgi:hypothetical protein|nr:hypothetical protein [Frankiales bacterium]